MKNDLTTRRLQVHRIWDETDEIRCFDLIDPSGFSFPPLAPGAHIDLHLPMATVRQYSICNGPDQTASITIAVKREGESRGGSEAMHRLREGDQIAFTGPRNNFPLDLSAKHHMLLAGGIGVTPLLSMALHLQANRRPFSLNYFARTPSHAAFSDILSADNMKGSTSFIYGMQSDKLRDYLRALLAIRPEGGHAYACGPRPFMDACVEVASSTYPAEAIHLEYFAGDERVLARPRDDFRVRLARRGDVINVLASETIIDALARHGVQVDMLCQQGVCGTCLTGVLEGIPDHRDAFLTDDEKRVNDKVILCCSRAQTPLLVLDL